MEATPYSEDEPSTDYACRHCGARIFHMEGHLGRYRWSTKVDGTDIFGSGSECPKNERGHEPGDDEWVRFVLTCPVCQGHGEVQPGPDPQRTLACVLCAETGEVTFEQYALWEAVENEARTERAARAASQMLVVPVSDAPEPF